MKQNIKYLIMYSIFAALMCISGISEDYLKSFVIVFILMFFALFATENLTGVLNYNVKLVIIFILTLIMNFYIFTLAEEKERYSVFIIECFWIVLVFFNVFIKKRLNSLLEDEILKWIMLYFILVIAQRILRDTFFLFDVEMFDMIVTTFLWRIISIVLHFKEEKYVKENI